MSIDKVMSSAAQPPIAPAGERSQPTNASVQPAPQAAQAPVQADELASPEIEQVAQRLESYMRSVSRSLEFRVDDESGRTVINVRDSQTGELIRQIPSEEVLRLAQMAEDQTIVLVNEKV